ncbi:hypothetical protein SASPL_146290 [Salvia splendens]|uniref:Uncharacterized protein n=1 Tax=Salvia splendens TaxID=180675 RepID=A0A8X8Z4R6_SALSN|nr:uncharacterized protein LOC121777815 [Salvia splendens]KAG6392082.1 hypothetical protein SASPL_146290 [Salvia splendens]
MDSDRPHFLTSSYSRRPASSMKLSKSLLSPGRPARDGPPALSSSLSRRLRPNGSLKSGHASPFFPTPKKRGFDNPEPSSPKVTCIGQVRVKSKKKKKKKHPLPSRSLSLSRRREVSFRKIDPPPPPQEGLPQHRNQRWVHLPISICEALRSFGAEFSCLFPCRSSCSNEERGKGEKRREHGCGAVLARWLVAEREIELVVGDGDDGEEGNEERRVSIRASRRHVFEDFEVKDDRMEETAAVGICIPPPNALLLMRCRSDPMKMVALANRLNDLDAGDDENSEMNLVGGVEVEEIKEQVTESEVKGDELEESAVDGEEEVESNMSSFEALLDQENAEQYDDCCCTGQVEESLLSAAVTEPNEEVQSREEENEVQEDTECSVVIKDGDEENDEEIESNVVIKENDEENEEHEETEASVVVLNNDEDEEEEEAVEEKEAEKKEKEEPLLPECLLLMMCEPKLSMEVSRETWVCSTDFTKWLPERPRRAAKEPVVKRRLSVDSKAKPMAEPQPPRSSCSLPAAAAMASMIERKLAACEPFVLTRCKSEPMRTAAGKLAPESCFWKNAVRKLEPHAMGVGAAARVGF